MELRDHNRRAWDLAVERGNRWTVPVGPAEIAAAREGRWEVVLTPTRPVPRAWFPPIQGLEILGLASAGGQQCPIFAAAGARVTVLDQSPRQLAQDALVAEREGLAIDCVEGDMADLSRFPDGRFDLVFHPCSNGFVPDVRPVWHEAHRVLRPGGVLLAGIVNPALYLFDEEAADRGEMVVRFSVPYSDEKDLPSEELRRRIDAGEPLSYSHTLEDQLGGQMDAGLVLTGLYEDGWPERAESRWMSFFIATRAIRPGKTNSGV
jgi:SAM-dependent methyltransferase